MKQVLIGMALLCVPLDVAQHPTLRALRRHRRVAGSYRFILGLHRHHHRQLMLGATETVLLTVRAWPRDDVDAAVERIVGSFRITA